MLQSAQVRSYVPLHHTKYNGHASQPSLLAAGFGVLRRNRQASNLIFEARQKETRILSNRCMRPRAAIRLCWLAVIAKTKPTVTTSRADQVGIRWAKRIA